MPHFEEAEINPSTWVLEQLERIGKMQHDQEWERSLQVIDYAISRTAVWPEIAQMAVLLHEFRSITLTSMGRPTEAAAALATAVELRSQTADALSSSEQDSNQENGDDDEEESEEGSEEEESEDQGNGHANGQ